MHPYLHSLPILLILSSLACNFSFGVSTPTATMGAETTVPPPSSTTAAAASSPTDTPSPSVTPSSTNTPPPPTPTPLHADWPSYENDSCSFQVRIPSGSVVATTDAVTDRIDLPFVSGTNLREKYLQVDCRKGIATCTSPLAAGYAPGSLPSGTRDINGTVFTLQSADEGAAGSFYSWTAFSTLRGDLCLSLTFVLRSVNALNFTPPLPEYSSEEETSVFEEIATTFGWVSP